MNINEDGSIETASGLVLRAEPAAPVAPVVKVPPMTAMRSNSISDVGYDGKQLFVRFKHGSLYRYPGVSLEQYKALRNAESVGHHLQTQILRHHNGYVVPEKG